MSNYFSNFPKVLYFFGDETTPVAVQNLTKFDRVIDEIADEITNYLTYEIKDFDRPDSLSHQLYGSSVYDWTFFVLNHNLRERGWPQSQRDLYNFATKKLYKDWTFKTEITTADSASTIFVDSDGTDLYVVGQEVSLNGYLLKVKSKNMQTGEINLYSPNYDEDSSFFGLTTLTYTNGTHTIPGTSTYEYLGTYEYRNDSDLPVDRFFYSGTKKAVTNIDKLIEENDKLKTIKIINSKLIQQVAGAFRSRIGR